MLPSKTILLDSDSSSGDSTKTNAPKTSASSSAGIPESEDEAASSLSGLGGYHGSIHTAQGNGKGDSIYYAVGVYSEQLPDGRTNGIPVFDQPWKNIVATFYHELNEARTDADVEDVIKGGNPKLLGWTSSEGEECGDFPVFEADPLTLVFQEVDLTNGSGKVPIQFQYSDDVDGPGEPFDRSGSGSRGRMREKAVTVKDAEA
jgi:hypothetical protein